MFIVLLGTVELVLVTVCVMVALSFGRRRHFWPRVFLCGLALPSLALSALLMAFDHLPVELVCPIIFATVTAIPFTSSQSLNPPSSPPGGDDDSGPGPDRPLDPPQPPRGDVPLPDGDPSRHRVRDHSSPKAPRVPRRREHEPAPARSVPIR